MSCLNIAPAYESMLLQVPVDTGLDVELRITFLSHQGAVLEVIAPDEFRGGYSAETCHPLRHKIVTAGRFPA